MKLENRKLEFGAEDLTRAKKEQIEIGQFFCLALFHKLAK